MIGSYRLTASRTLTGESPRGVQRPPEIPAVQRLWARWFGAANGEVLDSGARESVLRRSDDLRSQLSRRCAGRYPFDGNIGK